MFQSTHPHGVRRFKSPATTSVKMFQSTHPHGVRQLTPHHYPTDDLFQSTHPHGVRLIRYSNERRHIEFQSTHPHGVRPRLQKSLKAKIPSFNPRTHTGCDPACKRRLHRKFQVSIHAPTRGATLPCLDSSWPLPRFQSTHPHGVRLFSVSSISIPSLFQSTHPHGVRLWPSIPR